MHKQQRPMRKPMSRTKPLLKAICLLVLHHQYEVLAFTFRQQDLSIKRTTLAQSTKSFMDPTVAVETNANKQKQTSKLNEYQDIAAPIVKSFSPTNYCPEPLFTNKHFQTVGGLLFRKDLPELRYVKKNDWLSTVTKAIRNNAKRRSSSLETTVEKSWWDERKRIETPDGDWFHADYKYSSENKGLVILLHGLESNSESPLSQEMANSYNQNGMNVVCLNFRGCSGTPNDTLGGYHLGFTDDLRYYLTLVEKYHGPDIPVFLSGFSLGANTVLKALGELGEAAATEFNIRGAAVSCAPFDQEYNCECVNAPGFNKLVYAGNLMKTMKTRLKYQLDTFCDGNEDTEKFDYRRAMAATAITEFEDAFLAPVYGFDSYIDYYQKTSCIYFLDGIAVPTLIINSKDDPFFNPVIWPVEKSCEGGGRAPIKLVRTENGGHLGYAFHQISDEEELERLHADPFAPSWCSSELARFVEHALQYEDSP